ncbi:MAG: hypothetical protein WDA00_02920 [Eubacteriales bacterium]
MEQYKRLLRALSGMMSVSGQERTTTRALQELLGTAVDTLTCDRLGNHLCLKRCGRAGAPLLMIDTHFDQVGMVVTGVGEDGFLSVSNIGGVDPRLLPAAEVCVWGRECVYGVVASTPPHLQRADSADKLRPMDTLLIDTGYSRARAEELIPIGSPVSFRTAVVELANDRLAGQGFDNKATAAAVLHALSGLSAREMAYDVAWVLSAFEETSRLSAGVTVGAFQVRPELALVLDVNFAQGPGVEPPAGIKMGGGPGVTLSPMTHRALTRRVMAVAASSGIPYQTVAEAASTGTHSNTLPLLLEGIPTVDMSLPLSGMHTAVECVSAADGVALSKLLRLLICDSTLTEEVYQ